MTEFIDWAALGIAAIAAILSGMALVFYRRTARAAEDANVIAKGAEKSSSDSANEAKVANSIALKSLETATLSLELAEVQWREQISAALFVLEQRALLPNQNRKSPEIMKSPNDIDGLRVTIVNRGQASAERIEYFFTYRNSEGQIDPDGKFGKISRLDRDNNVQLKLEMTPKTYMRLSYFRLAMKYYDFRENTLVLDFSKPINEGQPVHLVQAVLNGVPQTNQALASLSSNIQDLATYTDTVPDGA